MKKIINMLLACSMAIIIGLGVMGCSASYSASAIKSNLVNAGYTVSEEFDVNFEDETKASELVGIQRIFAVAKGSGDNKEFAIILVFDSIKSVENGISSSKLIELSTGARNQCGDNKSDSVVMGTYNNVAFAGVSACRDIAGLK